MPRTAPCLLTLDAPFTDSSASADPLALAGKLGFDGIISTWPGGPFAVPGRIATTSPALAQFVALDIARFPLDHPLVGSRPALFATRRGAADVGPIDPRRPIVATGEARARLHDHAVWETLRPVILGRLSKIIAGGVTGLRLLNAGRIAHDVLADIAEGVRADGMVALLIDGVPGRSAGSLRRTGITAIVAPLADRPAEAVERYRRLRTAGPLLIDTGAAGADALRRLQAAAALGDGLIVPFTLAQAHPEAVAAALALARDTQIFTGEMRVLSDAGAAVTVLLRGDAPDVRQSRRALVVSLNPTAAEQPLPALGGLIERAGADFYGYEPAEPGRLAPGEARQTVITRSKPIINAPPRVMTATTAPRLVLEGVTPRVDGGDFAVKRVVGEVVTVEAILFGDGHEQLAAELQWRAIDEQDWHSARMTELTNDRWRAALTLDRLGRHEYAVEGWLDRFGGFRRDYRKKLDAGVAQPVDRDEGRALVVAGLARADAATRAALEDLLARIDAAQDDPALLLSGELAALMDVADDRPHRIRSAPHPIDAERLQARYSSWYELFPRSTSGDKSRHGTFADVQRDLPRIRDMGFDTLYFPPIHPIGATNRKGPNNTLTPKPGDPGSPYAIGSADGGHDALHPELGSFEDFDRLVAAAAEQGLEIAIDFAIQCSPDHPWLKEHPGWFAWRPDGSMKYAENPPKKYQDIVNVDFYGPDAIPDLWLALRDVVLLWIGHGVKTFRVDNPHTKPLSFWEWMIADVRAKHPETIFLAEAFTRPNMMYRLAKIGFSQSYTYFTWRDGKQELIDYITELTTTAPKDFYRPHLFVNTPDINPPFLQTSGRPGFRIRAVLAATLSGLFGVYSGFELCESAALPGREEYLDSEKYELRPRDWTAPGNIVADITLLNRLRRTHPALQTHLNTRFLVAHDDAVIYYAKPEADGHGMILVMVCLDPHREHELAFEVPLWEFGLPDVGTVAVEDLAAGHRFQWHGKTQTIRLTPDEPYRIWRIAPAESTS